MKVLSRESMVAITWLYESTLFSCSNQNEIFHYNFDLNLEKELTPKRATSYRAIAPSGNTAAFEKMSQRWRAFRNSVSNLTGQDLNLRIYKTVV